MVMLWTITDDMTDAEDIGGEVMDAPELKPESAQTDSTLGPVNYELSE